MLFVRRAEELGISKLDLAGGFVEFQESAITALNRKIIEELKLVPSNLKFFLHSRINMNIQELITRFLIFFMKEL